MADEAIQYMKGLKAVAPEKPFLVYYVPGGTHAPHHPTPEWIKKISDMQLFDQGWNKVRETIFANQKRLGIMPPEAQLTWPWPKELPQWDSLSCLSRRSSSSSRPTSLAPTWPIPTTRSAASSRRSRTWANSTTP
jgi:arylsulfatase A-like enzyme